MTSPATPPCGGRKHTVHQEQQTLTDGGVVVFQSVRAQQLRVSNEWSAGLKPTVFQKALQVNSEAATEDVGEGTGGNGKVQVDEDEYRRYGYKDPVIQLLCRSYMNIWA